MTRINLLPWREELREGQKREYNYLLISSAVFSIFIVVVAHVFMDYRISNQNDRNSKLQQEIAVLDKNIVEIKNLKKVKSDLLARMTMIQGLQENRPQVVHIFDDVVKILPKGVFLETLQRKSNQLVMQGFAESNTTISNLMRNVQNTKFMFNPSLNEIKSDDQNGIRKSKFELNIQIVNVAPKSAGDEA